MRDTALVIPSIREASLDRFLIEWRRTGLFDRVDLIIVEDNPKRTFQTPREARAHFCWEDIDAKKWGWIIPRRSDTVRSFGYWFAWSEGYQYLQTLDDDCYPTEGYAEPDLMHRSMLTRTKWFNTLNSVRPRGVPYRNTGKRDDIMVNHGIWQGVLDYDAPQQLVDPVPEVYTHDNRIVPYGAYFPFCGMNWMCRREAIPLMYHLLMGQRMLPSGELERLPFDRFGDIWAGLFMKKVCDHLGWVVGSGTPHIHHDRASDPFTNLRKEASGLQVNEWMWEAVDAIGLGPDDRADRWSPAVDCYHAIGFDVKKLGNRDSPGAREHAWYFELLGTAMMEWANLFTHLHDPRR